LVQLDVNVNMFERERIKPYVIRYALYLYFLSLSLRWKSKAIEPFIDRSYVAVWDWVVQRFNPKKHISIHSKIRE